MKRQLRTKSSQRSDQLCDQCKKRKIGYDLEDFDGLNTRVVSIEGAVSRIAQYLNSSHSSIASSTSTASPYHEVIDFSIHASISDDPFGNNQSGPQPRIYDRSSHRFMDAAGDEGFYGQSSAYASFD
ncbi:uncharacterized protein EAE98_003938 [Botrytis deweyae]|uniref:MADS-box domain-containing protein n=1 Tax=Botrytis deweyae TaxID=2478750 RepID=A0ABQ7ISC1_9HELO|nr:uncharacterized protein EAE98_003938 [Botrytis deweyae]KAF7932639.1 hypothetical protein EAE98_003938 [Botrytis deweyae]